ncbi:hypothetical protein [Candidatus Solirubrobacter pratensis]|uniref:hypothetical protein n=1 Tax=Candidatus Solirubrobacter pratensis TaxID=1298857 RepID=UPI00042455E1|nr:hypothetical protein [Candidatus Solirubrobacter pratensis]
MDARPERTGAERAPFTLSFLEETYPYIRWREPVKVTTPRGEGFDCRVCIASFGKRASDGPQFYVHEAALGHIAEHVEHDE